MAENTEFSSPQIGMGEPVKEEVDKIAAVVEKFKVFAKTRKFKIIAAGVILAIAAIAAIAVVVQIPKEPQPPATVPTPTPIVFPTETPLSQLPPHSSEAAKLLEELGRTIYDNPDLVFPTLDWKVTLQE